MSSHEARINDALKQLGEEFRLGMVQAEEYRARRRALIESWGEIEATTSPGSLRAKTATTPQSAGRAAAAEAPARSKSLVPLAIVAAIVIAVVAGYFALKPPAPPAGAVPGAEQPGAEVLAARKAADDFLAANAWDDAGVGRFLEVWRTLGPADRARALEEPSLRTLRYRLQQNIQAESQVVAPDATPEERQRLVALERFARELGAAQP
jgi:hypothetical protein